MRHAVPWIALTCAAGACARSSAGLDESQWTAGPVDAGDVDAGASSDAGLPDAAISDAGQADAGGVMVETPLTVRRLITLGSSSTAGAGASSADTRYVNVLAAALGAELVNLGVGGQTVDMVQSTYLPQALGVLDGGPPPDGSVDVVTFLPLTDFAGSGPGALVHGYAPVLTALEDTHAWVAFGIPIVDARYTCGNAGPLRGPDGECYAADLVADYASKEAAMRTEVARHAAASVVDIQQVQAQHPGWAVADGHPNDEGHAFIAASFVRALRLRLHQDAGPPPYP